ncbi:hypothetical protein ACFLRW_05180 [Acidobacteriota bacterium]
MITGSTGMVGSLVLQKCLNNPDIASVTSLVRHSGNIREIKLTEVIVEDFLDYSKLDVHFENQEKPNFTYKLTRKLYPLLKVIYSNGVITSEQLAKAMFTTGIKGAGKAILENRDIKKIEAEKKNNGQFGEFVVSNSTLGLSSEQPLQRNFYL